MIRIKQVKIYPYKCITDKVEMKLEKDITILTGRNEVGKTSVLEAMAKSNYFDKNDSEFFYRPEYDYPKVCKKEMEQQEEIPIAVSVQYEVSKQMTEMIGREMLLDPQGITFERTTNYKGQHKITGNDFVYEPESFWKMYASKVDGSIQRFIKNLSQIYNLDEYNRFYQQQSGKCTQEEKKALENIKKYFANKLNWDNPLTEYVFRTFLMPSIPQFVYYDEYFMMPSRISINRLIAEKDLNSGEKTAKALLLLADMDLEKFMTGNSWEDQKVEIELANAKLTKYLQNYWTTNPGLRVEMIIQEEKKEKNAITVPHKKRGLFGLLRKHEVQLTEEKELWLEIRIHDTVNMLSIPIDKRSKGFRWFFSFLIWFLAVENDKSKNFCFLLDEPGQNLHEVAQGDLLRLLGDLSEQSQFLITTHAVSMANEENVHKIRCMENHRGKASINGYAIEKRSGVMEQKSGTVPIIMG
ncbi:MAG: ATP-binding protein [Acetatifactor sp.]|nr:ATP-binding protein [Acetatifactor sp.]